MAKITNILPYSDFFFKDYYESFETSPAENLPVVSVLAHNA
jgi:hypothetical protein